MKIIKRLASWLSALDMEDESAHAQSINLLSSENRRAVRVQFTALHKIVFYSDDDPAGAPVRVANLSASGAAFVGDDARQWPDIGAEIHGTFEVEGQRHRVIAKIVHKRNGIIGCNFEGNTQEIRGLVSRVFLLEISALKMTQVKSEVLKSESDGTPFFFMDGKNCDLYYVAIGDAVLRYKMKFFGHLLEWENKHGFSYSHSGESLLAQTDQSEVRKLAVKFVSNISSLNPKHRDAICQKLTN